MRDFVELFVTKKIFFPAARSLSRIAGTPSMRESPFQMTPSQSKMKTSTESMSVAAIKDGIIACAGECDDVQRACEEDDKEHSMIGPTRERKRRLSTRVPFPPLFLCTPVGKWPITNMGPHHSEGYCSESAGAPTPCGQVAAWLQKSKHARHHNTLLSLQDSWSSSLIAVLPCSPDAPHKSAVAAGQSPSLSFLALSLPPPCRLCAHCFAAERYYGIGEEFFYLQWQG